MSDEPKTAADAPEMAHRAIMEAYGGHQGQDEPDWDHVVNVYGNAIDAIAALPPAPLPPLPAFKPETGHASVTGHDAAFAEALRIAGDVIAAAPALLARCTERERELVAICLRPLQCIAGIEVTPAPLPPSLITCAACGGDGGFRHRCGPGEDDWEAEPCRECDTTGQVNAPAPLPDDGA